MKKIFYLVGVLLLASSTINAQELKLDEVLDRYYKATGIDKLQNVKTIIMTGTLIRNDAMPQKVYKVRPNKYRQESDVADITGLQVFDGQNGWLTTPWTGNPKPQVATGPVLNDLKFRSDFDGIIYNWKAKEHTAELVGIDKVNSSDVFKIKLTRNDKGIEYYFIDCKSFLLVKKISYRMQRDKEVEVENFFSDFRNINGIMFPFLSENMMGGRLSATIQYESVELDKPIDEKIFEMPTK